MLRTTRRAATFLVGVGFALAGMPKEAEAFLFRGAAASNVSSTLIKTLTVQNTSVSATPTNSITPSTLLHFNEGDIPSGTWPILKTAGGTTVPYSYWNKATWADGSLSCLCVLPRFPDSVTGNGTAQLQVWSGGTQPTASNRTLSEVYAANFQMVGNGGIDNISGNWTCQLQSSNVIETVVVGDGPAGKVWRLLCNFNQSGSPHGQLVTYFYIMALQDASGNLAGFRILPRVTQPWYNYDTPAKNFRSFTSLQLQYGSGPTTFDAMANSYSAKTFTWSGSGNICNSTAFGYDAGVAVQLTTTGTLPTGLSLNTTYWVFVNNANQLTFLTCSPGAYLANGTGVVAVSGAGSGTHTMTPIPYVNQFCSFYTATTAGKYVYVQGAGSVASEATLRLQADINYDHKTGKLPPFNLSIGTVSSNSNYNWGPYAVGPLDLFIGTTGERDDIGVMSSYQARHYYTQAAVDEQLVRVIGLSFGMLPQCFKDHASKQYVNMSANSYSGMPVSVATTLEWRPSSSTAAGFTAPAGTGANWTQCFSAPDETHQTSFNYYAYIVTGEPQYYDHLKEAANEANMQFTGTDRNPVVSGTTYTGIGPSGRDAYRTCAWSYREIVACAAASPDSDPDGSAFTTYIRALAALQSAYMVAWINSNNSFWTSSGFWAPQGNQNGRASWQVGYFWQVTNFHSGALKDANALTVATNLSKWPVAVKTLSGNLWALGTYYEVSSSASNTYDVPYITSMSQWGPWANVTNLSWSTTGNLFTWTAPSWTPANGDQVMFWSLNRPGSNFSFNTQYYAINVSGNTFQLSATPNGSAITVQSNGDLITSPPGGQLCYPQFAITTIPANPPATQYISDTASANSQSGYGANQFGCVNWALALGITTAGLSACSTELAGRQSAVNYPANPKYAMQTSY